MPSMRASTAARLGVCWQLPSRRVVGQHCQWGGSCKACGCTTMHVTIQPLLGCQHAVHLPHCHVHLPHCPAAAPLPPHSLPPDWSSLCSLAELRIMHDAWWAAEAQVWDGNQWGGFSWGAGSLSSLTSLTKLQLSNEAILPGETQTASAVKASSCTSRHACTHGVAVETLLGCGLDGYCMRVKGSFPVVRHQRCHRYCHNMAPH